MRWGHGHSWLFFLSPLTAHFTSLSIFCSATVGSFVSLSAVFDSRRGLIHVQRLHLFPPSNLCCQRFYSVWMARLSCVCRTVLWVVDTFLHVQHETDCSSTTREEPTSFQPHQLDLQNVVR
uniref:Uncharacterized protein n=1 Tax=Oreochromis aureus TaxID=47969 RepID=A0A668TNT7_OREAU